MNTETDKNPAVAPLTDYRLTREQLIVAWNRRQHNAKSTSDALDDDNP